MLLLLILFVILIFILLFQSFACRSPTCRFKIVRPLGAFHISIGTGCGGTVGTDDFTEDIRAGHAVGKGLVVKADPMQDHVLGQREQVFGDHIIATVNERPGPRRL